MKETGNESDDGGTPHRQDNRSPERRIAIDAGSKYASLLLSRAIQFFLTPFLVRTIGPTFMGLMTLSGHSLHFVELVSSAVTLSYKKLAADSYARREFDAMNAILSCGFAFSLVSGTLFVIGSILVAVFANVLFDLQGELLTSGRLVILISGSAAALSIVTGPWAAPVFITRRLYIESITDIVGTVGATAGVVLAFKVGHPSVVAWAAILVGFRLGAKLFVMIPCSLRALPELRIRLGRVCSRRQLLQMTRFGGLNLLVMVGYRLYYSSDSIIIANLDELGPSQIFFYAVAQRWDVLVGSFIVAFAVTLTPLMTADAAVGNLERLRLTTCRGLRYCLLMGAYPCAVLAIFARPLLHHWLGEEFADASTPAMQLIMAGSFLSIGGIICHQVLFACGKLKGAAAATLAGGTANIVLSVVLVKFAGLGLYGVAIGSVLSLAALNAVFLPHFACLHLDLHPAEYLKRAYARPLAAALPLLLACLVIRYCWEPSGLLFVFVQFALCGVVYAVSAWHVALTPDDREKLLATLAKARAGLRALGAGG
jgi:O-antigen/teichoic acid export membrane protein